MCRFSKAQTRLGEGPTRETRGAGIGIPNGSKRSPRLTPEKVQKKTKTKIRRAERAFNKMPEEQRRKIRKRQAEKRRRDFFKYLARIYGYG